MKRCIFFVAILLLVTTFCFGSNRTRSKKVRGRSAAPARIVKLAQPQKTGKISVEQALSVSGVVDSFLGEPLKHSEIGQLAWAGVGIKKVVDQAGSEVAPLTISPLRLYFAIPEGLFVYNPEGHVLKQISDIESRNKLSAASLDQPLVSESPCTIIISGSLRAFSRLDKQSRRKMLLQAGRVAQKIQFQAASLGLGTASFVNFDTRAVGQLCRLPKTHEPILLISVGHPSKSPEMKPEDIREEVPSVKRAVFIIASENYRDEELFKTRGVLNSAGIETQVASSRLGRLRGMFGGMTESTVLINFLRVDSYDAIILIGGLGMGEYFGNPLIYEIIREAADKGKVLAAISIAPRLLAEAGVLGGVKATSFLSERRILETGGAHFSQVPVEKDGRIITASDPGVALLFGEAIADTLLIVQ